MKKVLCLFTSLVLVLFALLLPATAAVDSAAGYDASLVTVKDLSAYADIKTLASPDQTPCFDVTAYKSGSNWKITDAEGLKLLADIVNSTEPNAASADRYHFLGKSIYLANDIDMSGVTFAPIGDASTRAIDAMSFWQRTFLGTFDGQGHCIKNLVMSSSADGNVSVGLFGTISTGAQIRNLILDESCSFTYTGTSENARVGAVAAWIISQADEANVASSTVNADMGFKVSVLVENIRNDAAVSSTTYAGGIIGIMTAGTNFAPEISHCENNGATTGKLTAAGIVGMKKNRHVAIYYSKNTGSISSEGTAAGMLVTIASNDANNKNVVADCAVTLGSVNAPNAYDYAFVASPALAILRDNRQIPPQGELTFHGVQYQQNATATQNIRFVAGISENGFNNFNAVGMIVTVEDAEGQEIAGFTKECRYVYTDLLGLNADSSTVTYTTRAGVEGAVQLQEGGYLFAVVLSGIPTEGSPVYTFKVTPFYIVDELTVYGDCVSFSHTVGSNT